MRGQDLEGELLEAIVGFRHDPLGFVQFAYPWGERGTALEKQSGPQPWQADILVEIGAVLSAEPGAIIGGIPAGNGKGEWSTASGKGIGKSALVSWITHWGVCTAPDTKAVVTAGTEPQLRTKTWPELAKWHRLLICKHWFHMTATSMYAADLDHEKTWRADAIPWNASNPEAFAGLHNQGNRIVVVFDEASQIDDKIFETTDGIMTDADTEVIKCDFGNPTRSTGRFHDAFGKRRHRTRCRQIDSRNVPISDKAEIAKWIEDYGEDSDYVRVNVRGMFPRVSSMQFISSDVVAEARKREANCALDDALIMGVDIGRYGDDASVLALRKGRDARSLPWIELRGASTMQVVGAVLALKEEHNVDAIFVDEGGVGAGVLDRLLELGHLVRGIQFGAKDDRVSIAIDATRYANKRAQMWGYMREWLIGGAIPDDEQLQADCTGTLYGFRDGQKGSEIILEKKEHMKARGLASPDKADALALTFAYPVAPRGNAGGIHSQFRRDNQVATEYDIFG